MEHPLLFKIHYQNILFFKLPFFEHGGVPEIEIGPLQKNLREARFRAGRTGQLTASTVHMKHVHRCSRFAKKWRQVYLFMILCVLVKLPVMTNSYLIVLC